MAELQMAQAWAAAGKIISELAFQHEIDTFVDAYCVYFDDVEENKLEYTTLHNQYADLAEKRIEARMQEMMGPAFDMAAFLQHLPTFIEGGAGGITGADDKEQSDFATTLEVLLSFSDFVAFKSMMLAKKKSKETVGRSVSSLDVALEADLAAMGQMACDGQAWELVKKDGWITTERMRSSDGEFVRYAMEIEMPPSSAYDLMLNATPERAHWDDMTTFTLVGENLYSLSIKMPMMRPFTFHVKILAKFDYPKVGDITWVYRAFDPATGHMVTSAGAPVGKGCVLAVPGQPNRCVLNNIEAMPALVGRMPGFLMKWLLSFTPKVYIKMINAYKKYKGLS
jgi:hypothetical protein